MRKKNNPNLVRNWFILLLLLVTLYFGAKAYIHYLLSPASVTTSTQLFTINPGEGTSTIAEELAKKGLIRSSLVFKIDLKLSGDSGKLEAGDFELSPSMSVGEIIGALSKGGSEDKSVTIVEGLRDEEVAQKLTQTLGIDAGAFLAVAKQGYMFPDTYSFSKKATAEDVAKIMEDNFNKKYTQELQNRIQKQGLTPSQGVILGSLVEREARTDGVRTMVASILLKRLKIGMALDVDSTLQYALGYQKSGNTWWKNTLTQEDKSINSPYNTYLNPGLPPTPICNPSLSSLEAVANADPNTPYLYYYHDSQGNSYYAKTLDEQNKNAADHP